MDLLVFKFSEVDKIGQKTLMAVQSWGEQLLFELMVTHLLRNLG